MRGSATILGLILLVWVSGSVWWYTCKIKDNCISFSKTYEKDPQQLIIDLEGEEIQTFYLQSAGNGILQVMPGEKGNAIGIIRTYLDENPQQEIDLVAQNEDQANGLLAMMIISGVPNNRVNVFTDSSLGSKDRPMTIRSTFNTEEITTENYIDDKSESDLIVLDESGSVNQSKKKVNSVDQVQENKTVVKQPKRYNIPCPIVELESDLPSIESIYYPSAAYKVRCTSGLSKFAEAAAAIMSENSKPNLVVTGFTDSNQKEVNNYQLALKRAVEIKKYLIKRGIPGHRIETYSRGADSPIADNKTAEGKQLNRRVTIQWN